MVWNIDRASLATWSEAHCELDRGHRVRPRRRLAIPRAAVQMRMSESHVYDLVKDKLLGASMHNGRLHTSSADIALYQSQHPARLTQRRKQVNGNTRPHATIALPRATSSVPRIEIVAVTTQDMHSLRAELAAVKKTFGEVFEEITSFHELVEEVRGLTTLVTKLTTALGGL
jgi:hypothetical protein